MTMEIHLHTYHFILQNGADVSLLARKDTARNETSSRPRKNKTFTRERKTTDDLEKASGAKAVSCCTLTVRFDLEVERDAAWILFPSLLEPRGILVGRRVGIGNKA